MQVERGTDSSVPSGKRVSNTYPTTPRHGDSLLKGRLIPGTLFIAHAIFSKVPAVADGDALH